MRRDAASLLDRGDSLAVRLPDRGDGRGARVLRPSGMGRARARPQDARRCARDAAAGAAGVRGGRARDRSAGAAASADVRHRRRRADRRRTGRRAGRDRAAVAAPGFPPHPSRVGAHHAARRQPVRARARFPSRCATRRARRSSGWASRCGPASMVVGVDEDGVSWRPADAPRTRRRSASPRRPCCGRPAWRRRRSRRRSACRSIAPAACTPSRRLRLPGIPRSSSSATSARSQQDGKPLPGVAQVAMQEGAHAAKNVLRAIRGEPLEPFRYQRLRHMATIGRGSAVGDICRPEDLGLLRAGSSGSSCTSSG